MVDGHQTVNLAHIMKRSRFESCHSYKTKKEVRRSWRVGADCKSVIFGLSRFESYHFHNKNQSNGGDTETWISVMG